MEREDHNKNEIHDNRRKPVNKRIDDAYARYMADQNNHRIETNFRTIFVVVLASLIMAINLKSFVDQGDLVPGGFNGIIVLLQRIFSRFFVDFFISCPPASRPSAPSDGRKVSR